MTCELYIKWAGGKKLCKGPIEDRTDVMVICAGLRAQLPSRRKKHADDEISFVPAKLYATPRVIGLLKLQAIRDSNVLGYKGNQLYFHDIPVFCIEK